MDIGEAERSGRHRPVDDGAAIWLPLGSVLDHAPAAHAKPAARPDAFPVQRTRDPLADTDAVGLRKFNIGLVPASVTPPRTWQRAAWFAVLSSAAVLIGLAVAAAKLVGAHTPEERIGMPGYPSASPILTGFATNTTTALPPAPGVRAGAGEPDGTPAERPEAARTAGDRSAPPSPAPPATPSSAPVAGSTPGTPARPAVSTVPSQAKPMVDGAAVASLTELFYEEVATNSAGALAMVVDAFRADAQALLEQRFADVSLIEVTEISVDPAGGVTVSTLRVTKKDGTTSTEKRELSFTGGDDPLINAERPFDGA
ncbi:hypothetical protein FHS29_001518 [Saccharothrix tamanrassetensis]|uniref:Uncharacterized protein n=1 Tax=Saccharothrix tamanrassetensis TaxID=1051531 RepID=A0A841CFI9_9PSEU|nr:hypothetical protein [Saccharothrix tamanrassetensis]MBB5954948.1 hypothetical protein [Saccharothrix tamanrassetensis]